jgi:hypothetical protein
MREAARDRAHLAAGVRCHSSGCRGPCAPAPTDRRSGGELGGADCEPEATGASCHPLLLPEKRHLPAIPRRQQALHEIILALRLMRGWGLKRWAHQLPLLLLAPCVFLDVWPQVVVPALRKGRQRGGVGVRGQGTCAQVHWAWETRRQSTGCGRAAYGAGERAPRAITVRRGAAPAPLHRAEAVQPFPCTPPHLAALLADAAEVGRAVALERLIEGARDHRPIALPQLVDEPGGAGEGGRGRGRGQAGRRQRAARGGARGSVRRADGCKAPSAEGAMRSSGRARRARGPCKQLSALDRRPLGRTC